jgi:hypothetical protein
MNAHYQNAATTETLLYACKKGEPDHMEEIVYQCRGHVNRDELLSKGREWAEKNGYDRLRVSVVDLTTTPDFKGTVTV